LRLPAPNGIHFHPPAGLVVGGSRDRSDPMDPTDLMLEHDQWLTSSLIDAAGRLPEATVDQPVPLAPASGAFGEPATIRSMLDRLVWTREMWTAAVAGRTLAEGQDTSIEALRRRWQAAGAEFRRLVGQVREQGGWDQAFVDATCDPPQTFTFRGMLAHVLTWTAHRRMLLVAALRTHEAEIPHSDPISWEPSQPSIS